jgi:PPOX class probable F420-dependent enzyme
MAFSIDTSNEFGRRVQERLDSEQEIWLTVVNAKGEPAATLVWFIWHDDAVLSLSEPHAGKVKAIRNNPNVVLHFNSGPSGTNMIVLNGVAELLEAPAREVVPAAYLEKYRESAAQMELTEEKMFAQYSQPIRIEISRMRGH